MNIGASPSFDYIIDEKFDFGELQMLFSLKNGYIQRVNVFSDSLDTGFVEIVEGALLGSRFDSTDMMEKLKEVAYNEDVAEIVEYFRKNPL
jgi:lipoate-protein ligase A